jgi:hypothetical protein
VYCRGQLAFSNLTLLLLQYLQQFRLPLAPSGVGTGGAFGDLIVGSSVFFVHSISF